MSSWVVHLQRMPLGTPYPAAVSEVRELLLRAPSQEAPALVGDSTGVGHPVVDLIRQWGMPGPLVRELMEMRVRPGTAG